MESEMSREAFTKCIILDLCSPGPTLDVVRDEILMANDSNNWPFAKARFAHPNEMEKESFLCVMAKPLNLIRQKGCTTTTGGYKLVFEPNNNPAIQGSAFYNANVLPYTTGFILKHSPPSSRPKGIHSF